MGPERARKFPRSPGFWPGAPDLAAEVVSPTDTYTEVHEKGRVVRYRATDDVATFADEQPVDCAPAMPGFAPTVAMLLSDG